MPKLLRYQQARQYERFRCTGAACEDTCCDGWQVSVDRKTYEAYQECSHSVLGPQLQKWVQIQPAAKGRSFARIVLNGSTCPFLSEKLCSIHKELGEGYLGHTCDTFPRVSNTIAGVVERSLDPSCPEAARLTLTDSAPASFDEVYPASEDRWEATPDSYESPRFLWEIRSAFLSLLQHRRFSVAQRLVLVGHLCDKLTEIADSSDEQSTPELLEGFALGVDGGLYDAHLRGCEADASAQINTVLECMADRIKLDFVGHRFADLYLEVVEGLQLTPGTSMNEAGERYARAYSELYLPMMAANEHILEHYLVHYAYRSVFPFGTKAMNTNLEQEQQNSFAVQYMLMASYFAFAQSATVGLAAKYHSAFGQSDVLRCIQSCSRTFEHCTTYSSQLLSRLATKGVSNAAGMSFLTQVPVYRQGTLKQTSFVIAAGVGRRP